MNWRLYHKESTLSTNLDARQGRPGDVFTADEQTAGRGRLDHPWHSGKGENLALSAVLDVTDLPAEHVATLPLMVGLGVAQAVERLLGGRRTGIKWPNDVLVNGRKIAGILCERHGERVIAGLGVNVNARRFPDAFAARATSLALEGADVPVAAVREAVLAELARLYPVWRAQGLAAFYAQIAERDVLRGKIVEVAQSAGDAQRVRGICGGIAPSGVLRVGDESVYAGEAHILDISDLA